MAVQLPYLASYKNVSELFDRIQSAKKPEAFSTHFLYQTIGLKSKNDRQLVPLLKTLGFLDASGRPTEAYNELKNKDTAGKAIARAIRQAYAPLFAANEQAHTLSSEALKGLISQVAGSDENMTKRIAGTFNALLRKADKKTLDVAGGASRETGEEDGEEEEKPPLPPSPPADRTALRADFRYDIHIHLPSNGAEETYLNIFNALRKVFV